MSVLAKAATALRLLARFEFHRLHRQWTHNLGMWRIRRHHEEAFVFHDLGFPFVCHPDWVDSVEHLTSSPAATPDSWELRLVQAWLEAGDVFIDVGANLGFYTFCAAPIVGASGQVIAIDAAPFVVQKLAASVAQLGTSQVAPVLAAVTAEPGTVTFYVRADRHATTMQSLRPSEAEGTLSTPVFVPARTLADVAHVLAPGRAPALVKVDIEGAEAGALASAPTAWFSETAPLWIVEINPEALARFDTTPAEVLRYFPTAHFDLYLLPKCPAADQPTRLAETLQADLRASLYYNLVAVPRHPGVVGRIERIQGYFP